MKHVLLAIAAIFFGITLTFGQDIQEISTDSTQVVEKIQNIQNNLESVNVILNNWQLKSHDVFENYPEDKIDDVGFIKGKEFLNLGKNGEYESILNNNFNKGFWLQNNNLIVFKQKAPTTVDVYYQIISNSESELILKNANDVYTFVSDQHLSYISQDAAVDDIIKSQGYSFTSIWRGVLGMITLIFIAFLFSSNRKAINWKTVGIGLAFQLVIAIGVLKVGFIKSIFEFVGKIFIKILGFTQAGSEFLFGGFMDATSYGFIFAFQVLPTILFFSALTSVLFYLGIIQKVVQAMGWLLSKLLGISGAESLSVAGNIFLGQTEAPLLIKAYLEKMNKSEILLVMIGGMATVAGAVLAAYIGFLGGDDPIQRIEVAKNLIIASVMAAPGAIVISKLMFPQTEEVTKNIEISTDVTGTNLLSAITNGTRDGVKMAVNVGAMLLVFLALIALVNGIFYQIADLFGLNNWIEQNTIYESFSLELILGYLFAPLMWLIGIAVEDITLMGQLLGVKLAASEFVAYIELASLKDVGNALHLTYQKSVIMATIMLCGFANFASIGIQIGGIGILAPGKSKLLTELGFKAMIAGTLVSLLSATFVGMLLG